MFNKKLFESICNLTCEKEDFNFNPANRRKVKYDLEDPFIKYYSYDSIVKAFNKYINKEWDDQTLAHWFCVYGWILNGGFSSKTKSSLNLVEELITFIISDYLDSMSFFKEEYYLNNEDNTPIENYIKEFKFCDELWQQRKEFKAYYFMVRDVYLYSKFIVLVNDSKKQYMIIKEDYYSRKYNDGNLYWMKKAEFEKLIKKLENEKYEIINYDEDDYYEYLKNGDMAFE